MLHPMASLLPRLRQCCSLYAACALMLLCLCIGSVQATQPLMFGVTTYRSPEQTLQHWQPLADYLNQQLNGPRVVIVPLSHDEIHDRLARQTVDVLIAEGSDYILLRRRNPFTALLATVVPAHEGERLIGSGGVMFTRHEREDIQHLADLAGKRVAATHVSSLTGYQAQLMQLAEHGIDRQALASVSFFGSAHDEVVQAVRDGRADVGFVRSGLIETLIAEGRLEKDTLKVVNRQDLPSYPYALSTRLYPQWAVLASAHVKPALTRRIAAALMQLEPDHPAASAAGIVGFAPAVDYTAVEALLRELRLPPYDTVPQFSLADVWARHRLAILLTLLGIGVITGLAFALARSNLRLRTEKRALEQTQHALSDSLQRNRETLAELEDALDALKVERARLEEIIHGTHACTWEWDLITNTVQLNTYWAQFVGYPLEALQPATLETWKQFVHPDDLPRAMQLIEKHLQGETSHYECDYRLKRHDGSWRWVLDHGRVVKRTLQGAPQFMVGTHVDIQRLKDMEDTLHALAHFDQLTQLPNRRLLAERLRRALSRARRSTQGLAVCYLDLDGFKPINDQYGHEAGDKVLVVNGGRFPHKSGVHRRHGTA